MPALGWQHACGLNAGNTHPNRPMPNGSVTAALVQLKHRFVRRGRLASTTAALSNSPARRPPVRQPLHQRPHHRCVDFRCPATLQLGEPSCGACPFLSCREVIARDRVEIRFPMQAARLKEAHGTTKLPCGQTLWGQVFPVKPWKGDNIATTLCFHRRLLGSKVA